MQFEMRGEFIAVLLEHAGLVWYRATTLKAAFSCSLPTRYHTYMGPNTPYDNQYSQLPYSLNVAMS